MAGFNKTADAFLEMAHRIVWCTVGTVGQDQRPRSRVLHPIWERTNDGLVGWIATSPTPIKRAHLAHTPYLSCNYWSPDHDTCVAECSAEWVFDDDERTELWNRLKDAPEPVGYDPAIIPPWTAPTVDAFAGLKLTPWRLRVMPGSLMTAGEGELLTWEETSV